MTFLFYIALLISAVYSYTPAPRWGQATSIITSSLFIQGGKQDQYNQYSYTSAQAQGDLLYLPLENSFSVDSPPWVLISDPNNNTESHGPAVAWHTLSAFNNSVLLLFGGMPSPSVPIATGVDSAWLLNVYNRLVPQFMEEASAWANEPERREHHAAVSAITGEVYIFGGEAVDGSVAEFTDNYVFSPDSTTFTALPTDGAPPGLTGHAAIILPNGLILIFGGVSAGGLLSFNTFYIFDTNSNTWSTQTIQSSTLPPGRRDFAYVLLDGNGILIHGGCDAAFETTYSDGYIYNITTTTWTNVPALEDLGQRRDHFAVTYGGQVIFGFGYGQNGPANATLSVFDPAAQTFQPTYTAPPATSPISVTIPGPSSTDTSVGGTQTGSGTASSVHPTSTGGGGGGSGGGGSGGGSGGNNNGGGSGGGGDGGKQPESATSRTTAIAVGTVLGLVALVAAGLGAVWYMRRQRYHRWTEGGVGGVFSPLHDEENSPGGAPSAARMVDAPPEKGLVGGAVETVGKTLGTWGSWAAGALGLGAVAGTGAAVAARERHQRRDMLADEDTRDFGWYDVGDDRSSRLGRLRQGSGGSSWSLMSVFRPRPRREGSAASGLSFGSRPPMSRGGSLMGHGLDPSEKDPFADYMHEAAAVGGAGVLAAVATRPQDHRQASYASSMGSNYIDPFADPISEQDIAGPGALLLNTHGYSRAGPLSPVTEISRLSSSSGSAAQPSQSGSSNDHTGPLSPFSTISRSSFGFTSNSHQGSPAPPLGASPATTPGLSSLPPRPRASSILDMKPSPEQSMRRSDSWWARFASRSLLDRRSSRGSNTGVAVPEFRDPNPPPQRLGFVEEETSSVLRERSDGSDQSARQSGPVYPRGPGHGKSMSSIQTADSAALERMGNVDVTLRGNRQSGSTSTRGSVTTGGGSVDERRSRHSWVPATTIEDEPIYTSPVEMVPASAFGLPTSPPREPSPPRTASRPTLSTNSSGSSGNGNVADRVKAYERRMSQDVSAASPPPTNTKQREERTRKKTDHYGLVTRPNLFVANPDHRARNTSGDSQV
ncbi:Adagio protein 1-like [Mycena sanguinolenta]|uniref:Adagio protein 1-like n=1 Tax=Mycena sanguinolenta TaxID=230812 RepID=A0A8H7DHL3_9AGAR|nr:Adagio protein 1-like [Mycena sanguinolenta]